MSEKQRRIALMAILGVLLLVAVQRLLPKGTAAKPTNQAVTSGSTASRGPSRVTTTAARRANSRNPRRASRDAEIVELRVADLEKKPGEFRTGRNPFRYAPKVVAQRQAPVKKPDPRPAVKSETQPKKQKQPPKPRPPKFTYKFLGSFGPKEKPIAVFSNGEEIINAAAGEVLLRDFMVSKIGYESVDIGFTKFPDASPQRVAIGR